MTMNMRGKTSYRAHPLDKVLNLISFESDVTYLKTHNLSSLHIHFEIDR